MKKKVNTLPPVPVIPVVGRLSYWSPRSPWLAKFHTKN
jgi:hypothetical protein